MAGNPHGRILMKYGRGGARTGAGRPKGSFSKNPSESRSLTLLVTEWERLEREAADGSAVREAARRIRRSFEKQEMPEMFMDMTM